MAEVVQEELQHQALGGDIAECVCDRCDCRLPIHEEHKTVLDLVLFNFRHSLSASSLSAST